jgi:hypothetical protein
MGWLFPVSDYEINLCFNENPLINCTYSLFKLITQVGIKIEVTFITFLAFALSNGHDMMFLLF